MTSVTRYVKHERSRSPNLTEGQFIDRHLEYRNLALVAVDNILKCINENNELKEIENMRFEDKDYRKESDVAREVMREVRQTLLNMILANSIGETYDIEKRFADIEKKYTEGERRENER